MPQFIYKARDNGGTLVEGSMEAAARSAVVARLQQLGYFPIAINEGSGKGKASSTPTVPSAAKTKSAAADTPVAAAKAKRVPSHELATFNRQLADLISAGVPLVKGLAILSKQAAHPALKSITENILQDVQGGLTFAESLGRHPGVFSKLFVAMVRSGEAGGMLGEVLLRLADFSESEEQLRGKIKSVLAYPVVMVVASIAAIFVMFSFVIPKIVDTFKQMEQALPGMTLFLISVSEFFQQWWWLVLGSIAVAAVAAWRFVKTEKGRLAFDKLVLRIPVVKEIVSKRESARFARTFGSLLKNGVSILTALEIVREVCSNVIFRAEIERIGEEIKQGAPIAEPLRKSNVFPQVAVNMIATGEETGRLPEVLLRISESYEVEVERQIRTLTSLIEPAIIVSMGLIVGFLVIAMLLPIFTLDPSGGM
jgi:type IV pilus assembly protein PilC